VCRCRTGITEPAGAFVIRYRAAIVKITIGYSSQIWPGRRDKLRLLDWAWGGSSRPSLPHCQTPSRSRRVRQFVGGADECRSRGLWGYGEARKPATGI
jgi:hypothetical protein